jgi:hypothetical protein
MTTPIFVLGVAPRSGTNYIEDLLCVHPDCGLGVPLRENQLMSSLPDLAAIVRTHEANWAKNARWGFLPEHAEDLAHALGRGLIDFMVSQVDERRRLHEPPESLPGIEAAFKQSPRYLVSKHPRTVGLADFRRFFPDEKLILLIRDGRAVAESSIRSWGWTFDVAVDGWRRGAAEMAAFLDENPDDPALFVRYEDLITDPEAGLKQIFAYLDLDADVFDYEKALKRPVRGSSTARPQGADKVDWQPVEKTDSFDPLARARDWTDAQHERFNHMTGDLSVRFGYPVVETGSGSRVANLTKDGLLAGRKLLSPMRGRLREAFKK